MSAASVVSHYDGVTWMYLSGHGDVVPFLDRAPEVRLPVILGPASKALTY
jgi:hypothetical protein